MCSPDLGFLEVVQPAGVETQAPRGYPRTSCAFYLFIRAHRRCLRHQVMGWTPPLT